MPVSGLSQSNQNFFVLESLSKRIHKKKHKNQGICFKKESSNGVYHKSPLISDKTLTIIFIIIAMLKLQKGYHLFHRFVLSTCTRTLLQ